MSITIGIYFRKPTFFFIVLNTVFKTNTNMDDCRMSVDEVAFGIMVGYMNGRQR